MKHEGPFREMPDQLKKMEAEIEAEGKLSIKLPEDVKRGDDLPIFEDMLEAIDPKAIVLYSLATGLLRYEGKQIYDLTPKIIQYTYRNPHNPNIHATVELYEKEGAVKSLLKNKKKTLPARIVYLTTKAEVEAKTEEWESRTKENRKKALINSLDMFGTYIQHNKELVERGVEKELEETYFAELKELRTSLKLLLDTIDDKLEEKK